MKERGILFNQEMVRQLLVNRKCMTRRIVKDQNTSVEISKCPIGEVSDLLWVREEHKISFEQRPGFKAPHWICEFKDGSAFTCYSKQLSLNTVYNLSKRKTLCKWQRARFLPKEFARIWLMIREVTVERLKDINNVDAGLEGIETDRSICILQSDNITPFKALWESIHGADSWELNPLVWAVLFKRLSVNGRPNNSDIEYELTKCTNYEEATN